MSVENIVDKHTNEREKTRTALNVQDLVFFTLSTAFDFDRDPVLGLYDPFKSGQVAGVKFSSDLPSASDAVIDTDTSDPVASNT
jgi:adenylylsulfate kinase-like enzyme